MVSHPAARVVTCKKADLTVPWPLDSYTDLDQNDAQQPIGLNKT